MKLKDIEGMTLSELIRNDVIKLMIGAGHRFPDDLESYSSSSCWSLAATSFVDCLEDLDKDPIDVVMDIDSLALNSISEFTKRNSGIKKRKPEKSGNVYLMLNERNGYIKIGFTTGRPEHREHTLQSQEPEIKLINIFRGRTINDERNLHRIYDHKRVRGEWFNLNQEEVLDIEKIMGGQ